MWQAVVVLAGSKYMYERTAKPYKHSVVRLDYGAVSEARLSF